MSRAPPVPSDPIALLAEHVVPGTGEVLLERAGGGQVNASYRVRRDGRLYSLRVGAAAAADQAAADQAAPLGLDRDWECRVLARASGAGLAPPVEYCDPSRGILVMRWVEGRSWTAAEAALPENLRTVARLLQRVHALEPPANPRVMDPAGWIRHYRAARAAAGGAEFPGAGARRRRIEHASASHLALIAAAPPPRPVLCHSDLHPQNLLIRAPGDPVLLDWEYAHVADAFWDLASWASNADLTERARRALLECYLGREANPAEASRLGAVIWLYDYVCLLWSEIYLTERDGAAAAAVRARAEMLLGRL